MEKGLSVIICCYNSAWIIARTLEALKHQIVRDSLLWEIVLVDNNCQDDTIDIAQKAMRGSSIPFQIVKEPKPGLANARRRGIANANYDIVVYCDDDNLLCPNYIDTMYGIMRSDPTIGATGGRGIAEYQVEPAQIVRDNPGSYAVGSQMKHDYWLYGAGVTLRTSLVREVYEHQRCYLMGRKGGELLSGDDSELVMSMAVRGYRIVPTDDVYYTHVLKASRLTADYYEKLYLGLVKPGPVLEVYRLVITGGSFKVILRKYYMAVKTIVWHLAHYGNSDSRAIVKQQRTLLERYNYWGLYKLWKIYKSWEKIKTNAVLPSHIS